jgi:hypothetical protein
MMSRRTPSFSLFVPLSGAGKCGPIAVATISARDVDEVIAFALKENYEFRPTPQGQFGMRAAEIIRLAWHFMGRQFDDIQRFDSMILAKDAAKPFRLGIMVTRKSEDAAVAHAMPIVEGHLFNKSGYDIEPAWLVAYWTPKRGEIQKIVKKWGRYDTIG